MDLKKPMGRPPISKEIRRLVIDLYDKDMKCNDIAKACNISRSSVFRIINERRFLDGEK